jgi:hypothetical protein
MRRALALAASALALAGCGLGAGEEREGGGVELRVTRDFGRERIGSIRSERVREDQTVLRLLRSRFDIDTRFGGRFVQSIEGIEGGGPSRRRDWFYFVNGIEADVGAAEYELSPGDVVQWDYRRWDGAMRVPAIVGAFPEPFRHGLRGKRFPVRLECADPASAPCGLVKQRLEEADVRASRANLGTGNTTNILRVVVAPWTRARILRAVAALREGPERSGVFARFSGDGRRLELLAPDGSSAGPAAPGTGLIAALRPEEEQFIWLVTGADERAVQVAARAFSARSLRDAYAVAATPDGPVELPVEERP